jgi:hypothetical protein
MMAIMRPLVSILVMSAMFAMPMSAQSHPSPHVCRVSQSITHEEEALPTVRDVRVTGASCEVVVGHSDALNGGGPHNESIVEYVDQWRQASLSHFRATIHRLITKRVPSVTEHWICGTTSIYEGTTRHVTCHRGLAVMTANLGS